MLKSTFLIIILVFPIITNSQNDGFSFDDDFGTGNFKKGYRKEITKNNGYRIDTTSKKGRFNDSYLITYQKPTGKYGTPKRSEYGLALKAKANQTKFFALSFQIPKSLKFDQVNLGREIMIWQWHSKPKPGKGWAHYKKCNPFNTPSIAYYITTNDNKNFYLILRYGNNGKKDLAHKDDTWSTIAVKKIEIQKWHDLVIEIKWSFTNSGYVASYVDNEPLTPFNGLHNYIYGANMHNESPPYYKFGQYKYWDDSNIHEIYFDEVRVGDSFEEVSLYSKLPEMFKKQKSLDFIKNHK